jgi:hypothetical protein
VAGSTATIGDESATHYRTARVPKRLLSSYGLSRFGANVTEAWQSTKGMPMDWGSLRFDNPLESFEDERLSAQ